MERRELEHHVKKSTPTISRYIKHLAEEGSVELVSQHPVTMRLSEESMSRLGLR